MGRNTLESYRMGGSMGPTRAPNTGSAGQRVREGIRRFKHVLWKHIGSGIDAKRVEHPKFRSAERYGGLEFEAEPKRTPQIRGDEGRPENPGGRVISGKDYYGIID